MLGSFNVVGITLLVVHSIRCRPPNSRGRRRGRPSSQTTIQFEWTTEEILFGTQQGNPLWATKYIYCSFIRPHIWILNGWPNSSYCRWLSACLLVLLFASSFSYTPRISFYEMFYYCKGKYRKKGLLGFCFALILNFSHLQPPLVSIIIPRRRRSIRQLLWIYSFIPSYPKARYCPFSLLNSICLCILMLICLVFPFCIEISVNGYEK